MQLVRTQKANLFTVTEKKKTVSKKVGVFFVGTFANGLIFNLEHNSLNFGGFRFSLFEKESKLASSNSFSLDEDTARAKETVLVKFQLYKVFLFVCLHFRILHNQKIV